MLAALIVACRVAPGERPSRTLLTLGLPLNAGLAGTYLSQAAALVVFEGLLCLALLACRRTSLARIVGVLAAVGAASLLVGALTFWSDPNAIGLTFASRLPVLTPSVIGAALGLLLLATVLRRSRSRDLYPVAAACFGSVLVLTNQQLLSGRMILVGTWERYVDYPLVFLGAAIVAAWLLRGARVGLPALYAVAGAALVLMSSVLLKAQDRLFQHEYLVANLESVAMRRAVEAVEAQRHARGDMAARGSGRVADAGGSPRTPHRSSPRHHDPARAAGRSPGEARRRLGPQEPIQARSVRVPGPEAADARRPRSPADAGERGGGQATSFASSSTSGTSGLR